MATAASPHLAHTHPIHGMLAAYPLAMFTAALATDLAYVGTYQVMWSHFSIWLITGGLAGGVLAAIAGIVGAIRGRGRGVRPRRPWPHSLLTLLMLALALVNAFVHSRDGWTAVWPGGLILSAIVAVLALVTSWNGYALQARQEAR